MILCDSERIGLEHLPADYASSTTGPAEIGDAIPLEKLEELHIRRVLAKTKSLDEAAKILGIDSATLWRRRKKYGI